MTTEPNKKPLPPHEPHRLPRLTSTDATPTPRPARLGRARLQKAQAMVRAWEHVQYPGNNEHAARAAGVSTSHMSQARAIDACLKQLLGLRLYGRITYNRLSFARASKIAGPITPRIAIGARRGDLPEPFHTAWSMFREPDYTTVAMLEECGVSDGNLGKFNRVALRRLADALRFFNHDIEHMQLSDAVFNYRSEVLSRRLLPLHGASYDADAELWTERQSPYREKGMKHGG